MARRLVVVSDGASLSGLFVAAAAVLAHGENMHGNLWRQLSAMDEMVRVRRPLQDIQAPRDMRPPHQGVREKPFHGNHARNHLRRG